MDHTDNLETREPVEISESTKIHGLVWEEEKKIDRAYYQIGKLYASLHRTDGEAAFADMLRAVAEAEKAIGDLWAQLQALKQTRSCSSCGADVAQAFDFCTTCGKAMDAPAQPEEAPVEEAAPAQPKEASIEEAAPAQSEEIPVEEVVPAQPEEAPVEEAAPAAPANKCPACGAAVQPGMRFCTSCGKPMTPPAAPAASAAPASKCLACGAAIQPGTRFCTSCGKPVAPVAPAAPADKCPACGAAVRPGMRFCTTCGKPVVPVARAERVCANCGNKLEANASFCTECGTRV